LGINKHRIRSTFLNLTEICELLHKWFLDAVLCVSSIEHFMDLDKLNLVKLTYGCKILGLAQFSLLPQLPLYDVCCKSGQK